MILSNILSYILAFYVFFHQEALLSLVLGFNYDPGFSNLVISILFAFVPIVSTYVYALSRLSGNLSFTRKSYFFTSLGVSLLLPVVSLVISPYGFSYMIDFFILFYISFIVLSIPATFLIGRKKS